MISAVRLLPIIFTCAVAQAVAGAPAPSSGEPPQSAAPPSQAAPADAATHSAASQSSSSSATPDSTAKSTDEKSTTATGQSSATTSTSTTPTKVVLNDKTLTEAQVKQLLARGYKPQSRGGDVLYCRREQQLGSHFETKICKSAAQIMQDELDSKETTRNMQLQTPGSMGPGK